MFMSKRRKFSAVFPCQVLEIDWPWLSDVGV